ncbi:MAG: tol-pal system protein YbgF [Pseudomonadota bacterium]|nr:tol-pal system protein YbgF [Pseudomonadota bacterium]
MRLKTSLMAVACAMTLATPGIAQDRAQTLADVRQELTVLNVELARLRTELNTTGAPNPVGAGSTLDRVNAIEAALTRLTNKTEELEFKLNSVATDGANRIGDLSFRLCELESDCDIMNEGLSKPLGGVEAVAAAQSPTTSLPQGNTFSETNSTQLAVGEQADFDAAMAAMNAGNFADAATRFQTFVDSYPGTPMTGQALFLRGEALNAQNMVADAARAYLASFSADPTGQSAPDALVQLGTALGQLGQVNEACATLGEVPNRFPGSNAAAEAQAERQQLGCL